MSSTCRFWSSSRWWGVLVVLGALLAPGCGDVNIEPWSPTWVFPRGGVGLRTLHITASLTAEQGGCIEARVLYDGQALPDSTVVCPDAAGCVRLDLTAETTTGSGRHTLALQVVRQPHDATVYVARVSMRMTRDGLGFVLPISPDPVRTTLRAGGIVSFELQFLD